MAKILIVEDDSELADVLNDAFEKQHSVEIIDDGNEALDRLKLYNYDLLILDWGLPGLISGIEVCRQYRMRGGKSPVLMLTGKSKIDEKESGLDAGADDYLTKPFDVRELIARVRALLRRPSVYQDDVICAGPLKLDSKNMTVMKDGQKIALLPKEFALLQFLMNHPNQYFTAETLLERLWSSESETSPEIIRIHITRLRKKIDSPDGASLISTKRNAGYMFEG